MIDVCLLLEGTYPYVAGGVSTWVHQLITAMRDIRFGIIYIAPHSDPTRQIKYEVPNHVLYLKEVYLHDYDLAERGRRKVTKQDLALVKSFYERLAREDYSLFERVITELRPEGIPINLQHLFTSKTVWQMLEDFYDMAEEDVSFIDFFWTWRGTHLPVAQIVNAEIPRAKIYHSVSTGYAGLMGALAKIMNSGKYFLTEHGIYTHERALEISQANWIYENEKINFRATRELSFFKQWWVNLFKVMSHLSYQYADQIFTLYEGNRLRQIIEGADKEKISIIPNGINLDRFSAIKREKKQSPQIGLIGRVVPIKDVKTFIQSAKLVLRKLPEALFYIIGPTDEEEEYYIECRNLVESLKISDNVIFTGRVDVAEYYAFMDVVVLTSVSEAQPYVILEANICGIPCVASDVGSCRELLFGRTGEDQRLGQSGMITEVSNPDSTAEAVLKTLQDKELYNKMAEAGIKRVKTYYDQDDLLSRYLNVYEQNL
ncbi:MAG: GT4 family glycosyltransferase PelF [Deltaproteobacteria bacterium]|nr:GT4 family glycosyltransferase PelF [Deltaproteobacteria bacterium]